MGEVDVGSRIAACMLEVSRAANPCAIFVDRDAALPFNDSFKAVYRDLSRTSLLAGGGLSCLVFRTGLSNCSKDDAMVLLSVGRANWTSDANLGLLRIPGTALWYGGETAVSPAMFVSTYQNFTYIISVFCCGQRSMDYINYRHQHVSCVKLRAASWWCLFALPKQN